MSTMEPWETLNVWQRGEKLIKQPEMHLDQKKVFPIVHIWYGASQLLLMRSVTVFRQYEPGPSTNWIAKDYVKVRPYQAKHIVWEQAGNDLPRMMLLEDPALTITQGEIDRVQFETFYDEAKTLTVPLVIEDLAPQAAREMGGLRVYPYFEMRFMLQPWDPLTPAIDWIWRLEIFLEKQLGVFP